MPSSIEDFERPISELEAQIERVQRLTQEQGLDRGFAINELKAQVQRLLAEIYANPTGWDKTRISRHPRRPYALDFIRLMFNDFVELHGDRFFSDDGAMVGGVARLNDQWVTVVGHQKGRDAQERHKRNFGYARPDGYRKALRLMQMSDKFRRPIICLVDTPGADCSVPSEERGISEAIARNIREMFLLKVPVIVVVTGEGGSGGALGIGVGDRNLMMEHATYSVIAPEGCAAILWRDPEKAPEAAEALRITGTDAMSFGIVDEVVPEPLGGAHRDYDTTARNLKDALQRHLQDLQAMSLQNLLDSRYERYRRLGQFTDLSANGA
jgi:acetyl-CoA carboxylase carboxyl transferase subunit alpha